MALGHRPEIQPHTRSHDQRVPAQFQKPPPRDPQAAVQGLPGGDFRRVRKAPGPHQGAGGGVEVSRCGTLEGIAEKDNVEEIGIELPERCPAGVVKGFDPLAGNSGLPCQMSIWNPPPKRGCGSCPGLLIMMVAKVPRREGYPGSRPPSANLRQLRKEYPAMIRRAGVPPIFTYFVFDPYMAGSCRTGLPLSAGLRR
jgi:hypothetical protein